MRILFMGTPDFAASTLEALLKTRHEIIGVVTQPDKPKGRGKELAPTPVKEMAKAHHLSIYQPIKVRDAEFVETIKKLQPEIIVVVAFGQIIPQAILSIPIHGCMNVHASLLPKYRGAAPIQWAVLDGEKESGITTMKMDAGLDTGDMIEQVVVPLDIQETGGSLFDKLSKAGAALCVTTLDKIEQGTAIYTKQPKESPNEYAKMIDKKMGSIDWEKSAVEIERWVRGLNPWPSAYTSMKGKNLKIWKSVVLSEATYGEAGEVLRANKEGLCVQTGRGILSIQELQLEGKKRMDIDSFLRGYPVLVGTRLGDW